MKIYTKGGDKGRTSLIGGERVLKSDTRVEAYGTIDELSAHIAMLKDMLSNISIAEFEEDLTKSLRTLMSAEAIVAMGKKAVKNTEISQDDVKHLELRIDEITETLTPINAFTIPGGNVIVSQTHICRTVCRRAERRAVLAASEHDIPQDVLMYLNRLSDYLYVLGRRLSERLNVEEILWIP